MQDSRFTSTVNVERQRAHVTLWEETTLNKGLTTADDVEESLKVICPIRAQERAQRSVAVSLMLVFRALR